MNILLCDSIKESFAYVSSNAARTAISKLLRPSEVLELKLELKKQKCTVVVAAAFKCCLAGYS